jgi:GNAT superfamily N-acetyltransferase
VSSWRISNDWDEFAFAALDYLAVEPEQNTLAITTLDGVISGRFRDPPPTFGWHRGGSSIDGAFLITPPHVLILVGDDQIGSDLGRRLRGDGFIVPGVNAVPDAANAFCSTYLQDGELAAELVERMLLYRLEDLVDPPISATGAGRLATGERFDLCLRWFEEMRAEVGGGVGGDLSDLVDRRIASRLVWLWETDGEPVSLAARSPDAAGVARIGPVYTPPHRRRRGFASAVTYVCARDALDRGSTSVVLFTDRANPTSNAIYQTIGFRPIGERAVMLFRPRTI